MPIRKDRSWEEKESRATPESVFHNRRRLIAGLGASALVAAAPLVLRRGDRAQTTAQKATAVKESDPSAGLYPVARNPAYTVARDITSEGIVTSYNNFYEFGSQKTIAAAAQALSLRPWQVSIEGMVESPKKIDIDDLLGQMPLEERLYRLRCVEAWSIVVPWSGFPMRELVKLARPLSSAKYVLMETFENMQVASGQRQGFYPWPYTEGLTMAEATNELAFMVTGAYGKPVPKQNGAPLRLATPWKYGFKSIKSIVRIVFTDQRPRTFWEHLAPSEYGFWANVNPDVPHPRWSQKTERVLGTDERVPTQLFNGYGDYVAEIYAGMRGEPLFR